MIRRPPTSTPLSLHDALPILPDLAPHPELGLTSQQWRNVPGLDPARHGRPAARAAPRHHDAQPDRKSTRLNSSHSSISYAVFCLKKKTKKKNRLTQPTHSICK